MCENGTATTPDHCKSLIPPECTIALLNQLISRMTITCTETVVFGALSPGDISISISGPLSPYKFTYVLDETTGFIEGDESEKFYVQFTFLTSFIGGNQETIRLNFNNKNVIQDLDQNNLFTNYTEVTVTDSMVVVTDAQKAAASSQSSASLISLLLTFGTSIFIQVALGGTIEATWLLLGTLQLMSLLPLVSLNIPINFREFSKNLAVLNGEPEAFPNIFEYYYNTMTIDKLPFNQYFELMNFKTKYLLLNAGRKVMIWIGITVLMAISVIFFDLFGHIGKFGTLITKIDTKLRYGMIIRAISQSYLSLVLSTCLNVYTISWSGNVSLMSNVISLSAAVVMMYIPIISFNIINRTANLNDLEFQKRYKTFIIDLRTTNPL